MSSPTPSVFYFIKKPSTTRRTYSTIKETRVNKKRQYETVKSKALDSINTSILTKQVKPESQLIKVKSIVKSLYNEVQFKDDIFNSDNQDILSRFLEETYSDRTVVDLQSAVNDYKRAINTLGPVSIQVATKDELQKQINKTVSGNKQRRVIARLTTILKWLNRNDIKLRKDREEKNPVKYLTEAEFEKVLTVIDDEIIRLILIVSFYTGLRLGEIFDIDVIKFKNNHLVISSQLTRNGTYTETKTRKIRTAYILPEGRKHVEKWVKFKNKKEYRLFSYSKIVQKACRKVFDEPNKFCCFHDLRHSYAINLLSKNVSISLVSQSLGNSVLVCQKYYLGYSLTQDSISLIDQIVS